MLNHSKINNKGLVGPVAESPSDFLRNGIINGQFDFWQRGTSLTISTNDTKYIADRFKTIQESWAGSPPNITVSRDTDVPAVEQSGINTIYSQKILVNTIGLPVPGGMIKFEQTIEGNFFKDFFGRKATLSFWIKSNKVGTYYAYAKSGGTVTYGSATYIASFTINESEIWELKEIPIDFSEISYYKNRFNFNTNAGVSLGITLVNGQEASAPPTNNAWNDGIKYGNTGSSFNVVGAYAKITNVQFYEGSDSKVFQPRSYSQELSLCQRYYEKNLPLDVYPGTSVAYYMAIASLSYFSNYHWTLFYKTMKRTATHQLYFWDMLAPFGTQSKISLNSNNGLSYTIQSKSQSHVLATYTGTGSYGNIFISVYTAEDEF